MNGIVAGGHGGSPLARTFRADPQLASVFLVALSGYALPQDVERATIAGFHLHLPKPPTMERLEQVLADAPETVAPEVPKGAA